MNEKPSDVSNITPIMSTVVLDNDGSNNQTVDILQELLNTIKQNNQLEVKDLSKGRKKVMFNFI